MGQRTGLAEFDGSPAIRFVSTSYSRLPAGCFCGHSLYLLAGLAKYGRLLSIASLQMVVAVDVWMATTERDLKR